MVTVAAALKNDIFYRSVVDIEIDFHSAHSVRTERKMLHKLLLLSLFSYFLYYAKTVKYLMNFYHFYPHRVGGKMWISWWISG